MLLVFAPKYYFLLSNKINCLSWQNNVQSQENRITIPKHGINAVIYEGDANVLDNGAWHQYPERGNPETGGNFILAAHSFFWGYTPAQVINRSFFYNLNDVKIGEEVNIRYQSKDYVYIVSDKFQITPNDTSILAPSDEAKMTIYTCTVGGSADGRVVVIAKPKN